jgi:hypothetical protein
MGVIKRSGVKWRVPKIKGVRRLGGEFSLFQAMSFSAKQKRPLLDGNGRFHNQTRGRSPSEGGIAY